MATLAIETPPRAEREERPRSLESASDDPLLRSAALLAGLGRHLPALLPELALWSEPAAGGGDGPARTCIEAGADRMLSLAAPGGRALRLETRLGPAVGGIAPWLRLHAQTAGGGLRRERWRTETLAGESPEALPRALAAARRAGAEERFRRCHALLGAHGRICLVSWSLGRAPARAAVAWQLDRALPPSRALAACGAPDAWPAAAEILAALTAERASERGGPWSLLVEWTAGDDALAPRLRLGTTAWARRPEDDGKRRRLADAIAALGGDGPFAEALYKLVAAAAPSDRPNRTGRRIGRAVEIAIEDGRVAGLEAYLRLPETLPTDPPTERT